MMKDVDNENLIKGQIVIAIGKQYEVMFIFFEDYKLFYIKSKL